MFSVLVIRLRSLRLLRVSGIVMRLRMRSEERFSRNAETDLVCRLLLEKKNKVSLFGEAQRFTHDLEQRVEALTQEFFFTEAATTEIYTLSLHDALPICNLPPREISMKDVFRSGDSSKKFKIAEGQWYRYAPSYVSPAYHLLEGFPFIQEPPSGDLQERVLIRHHDYDQCFQSVQLLQ